MNLVVMFLFAMSIYSVIRYTLRRSGNKRYFVQLKKKGKVLRTLSPAEREALTPVLHLAGVGKPLELLSDKVYELNGEFFRHGLQGQHGSTMHDTLGGVDVSLPYDATMFLSDTNRAEVVLTKKRAIVISLNGSFDLLGGQERAQENLQQENKWENGAAGVYGQLDNLTPEEQTEVDAEPERFKVQMLGQRTENPGEMAARFNPGIGFWASCLLVAAFMAAMVANSHVDSQTVQLSAIGVALVLVLLAARSFWRKPKALEAQKINQARGYLHSVEIPDPNNANIPRQEFFLGNKLPVIIPSHWLEFLSCLPDRPIDIDIRVENRMLVKLGPNLALGEEEQCFPDFFWGRHFTVALVAVVMAFGLFVNMADPVLDLRLGSKLLTGTETITLNNDQANEAAALEAGDMVNLTAQVRCELPDEQGGYRLLPLNCRQVRWGGVSPQVEPLETDELLHEFLAGQVIKTRNDSSLLAYSLRRYDGYGRMKRIMRLKNFSDVTQKVDALCQQVAAIDDSMLRADCRKLKSSMLEDVVPVTNSPFASWDELLSAARSGKLKSNKRDEGVLLNRVASSLSTQGRQIAEKLVLAQAKEKFAQIARSDSGGVLLTLNYDKQRDLRLSSQYTGELLSQWATYEKVGDPATYKTLTLEGLVVRNEPNAYGVPVLLIAEEFTPGWILSATVRVVTLTVLVLLAAFHGLLMISNYRNSKQRQKQVDEYNRMRLN